MGKPEDTEKAIKKLNKQKEEILAEMNDFYNKAKPQFERGVVEASLDEFDKIRPEIYKQFEDFASKHKLINLGLDFAPNIKLVIEQEKGTPSVSMQGIDVSIRFTVPPVDKAGKASLTGEEIVKLDAMQKELAKVVKRHNKLTGN